MPKRIGQTAGKDPKKSVDVALTGSKYKTGGAKSRQSKVHAGTAMSKLVLKWKMARRFLTVSQKDPARTKSQNPRNRKQVRSNVRYMWLHG